MKIAITKKTCIQTSPDDWESFTRVKEITRETTVGELIDWQHSFDKLQKEHFDPMQIIEMDD